MCGVVGIIFYDRYLELACSCTIFECGSWCLVLFFLYRFLPWLREIAVVCSGVGSIEGGDEVRDVVLWRLGYQTRQRG